MEWLGLLVQLAYQNAWKVLAYPTSLLSASQGTPAQEEYSQQGVIGGWLINAEGIGLVSVLVSFIGMLAIAIVWLARLYMSTNLVKDGSLREKDTKMAEMAGIIENTAKVIQQLASNERKTIYGRVDESLDKFDKSLAVFEEDRKKFHQELTEGRSEFYAEVISRLDNVLPQAPAPCPPEETAKEVD